MARAIVFFYDEKKKRHQRKRLRGERVSHKIEGGFFEIVVDDKIFIIKEEHVISLDIIRED